MNDFKNSFSEHPGLNHPLILEPVFQPGEIVYLRALGQCARVGLLRFDGHQVEFFVNWWAEGKRCGEWVYAAELISEIERARERAPRQFT